jgi:predicted alternative tryptophan synthase beta-subunit
MKHFEQKGSGAVIKASRIESVQTIVDDPLISPRMKKEKLAALEEELLSADAAKRRDMELVRQNALEKALNKQRYG